MGMKKPLVGRRYLLASVLAAACWDVGTPAVAQDAADEAATKSASATESSSVRSARDAALAGMTAAQRAVIFYEAAVDGTLPLERFPQAAAQLLPALSGGTVLF